MVNSEVGLSAVRARHFNFLYEVVHLLYHGLKIYKDKNSDRNRCSQVLKYVKSFLFN